MLKMNYSNFEKKNYNQLIKECERRGIQTYDSKGNIFSPNDLVGRIIAYDAYYEGRDDALNGRPSKINNNYSQEKRERYILSTEDDYIHNLKLTESQKTLMTWLMDNDINLYNAQLLKAENEQWIEP